MKRTEKEIGSEFEYTEPAWDWDHALTGAWSDCCFVFSGRTAISLVLEDADAHGKAMLPSYCCDSMVEPFRKRGMDVGFYHVKASGGFHISFDEIPDDCTVLMVCGYFGFEMPRLPEETVHRLHDNHGIIVEDITHSLLSGSRMCPESDYTVASLRKWFPLLSGGVAGKRSGSFRFKPTEQPSKEFLELKQKAMMQKRAYISAGNMGEKDAFLQLFRQANDWLATHDSNLRMDDVSLRLLLKQDIATIRERRRGNAYELYRCLEGQGRMRFLFGSGQVLAPLFVPVVLEQNYRERVHRALIQEGVYCPVHWPKPNADCESDLYETELSLVCDQRYDEPDMQRMAEIIKITLAE